MSVNMNEIDYAHVLNRQCIIHLFLQSKSARIYNFVQSCITVPNIVIGGIMSISIFSTTSEYWRLTTGGLAIATTILSSLSKHVAAGERAQLHCSVVRQYQSLIQEIDAYIQMLRTQPPNTTEKRYLMDRVHQHLNRLYDIQPEPSYWAINDYEKRYKKKLEEALFDELESAALQNAAYVQLRLSRVPSGGSQQSREAQ
jgi:hypothetical protein